MTQLKCGNLDVECGMTEGRREKRNHQADTCIGTEFKGVGGLRGDGMVGVGGVRGEGTVARGTSGRTPEQKNSLGGGSEDMEF
jgi:hypothetical protein